MWGGHIPGWGGEPVWGRAGGSGCLATASRWTRWGSGRRRRPKRWRRATGAPPSVGGLPASGGTAFDRPGARGFGSSCEARPPIRRTRQMITRHIRTHIQHRPAEHDGNVYLAGVLGDDMKASMKVTTAATHRTSAALGKRMSVSVANGDRTN